MKKIIIIAIVLSSCGKKTDYRCNCNEPMSWGSVESSYMIWESTLQEATDECTANSYCVLQEN